MAVDCEAMEWQPTIMKHPKIRLKVFGQSDNDMSPATIHSFGLKDEALSNIRLTVYPKNRSAIEAYEKMGFKVAGTIHRDLGNGIVFDDILMQKRI